MKSSVTKKNSSSTSKKSVTSQTISSKKSVHSWKTVSKKNVSKIALKSENISPFLKNSTHDTPIDSCCGENDGVRILGVVHFIGNVVCPFLGWVIVTLIYYFVRLKKLSVEEKKTCFEIFNFHFSYLVYLVLCVSISCLGFILQAYSLIIFSLFWIWIFFISWFISLIISFFKHICGKMYRFSFIFRLLK